MQICVTYTYMYCMEFNIVGQKCAYINYYQQFLHVQNLTILARSFHIKFVTINGRIQLAYIYSTNVLRHIIKNISLR